MDGEQQLDILSKDVSEIKTSLAVNTVKTSNVEKIVADIQSQFKDVRLAFLTHSEYEIRHTSLQEEIKTNSDANELITTDHESRLRVLEAFKSVVFGGLILSNVIIVPILIWLTIRALENH